MRRSTPLTVPAVNATPEVAEGGAGMEGAQGGQAGEESQADPSLVTAPLGGGAAGYGGGSGVPGAAAHSTPVQASQQAGHCASDDAHLPTHCSPGHTGGSGRGGDAPGHARTLRMPLPCRAA